MVYLHIRIHSNGHLLHFNSWYVIQSLYVVWFDWIVYNKHVTGNVLLIMWWMKPPWFLFPDAMAWCHGKCQVVIF